MKTNLLTSAAVALGMGAVLALSSVGAAEAQTRLTLKSAASTSSYYVMMVQLAELIRSVSDNQIQPTVEESQGSVQNVKEAGRRPGAFLFTTPPSLIEAAREGSGAFEGDDGSLYDPIRTLFVMPFVTVHLVVDAESDVEDITDLAGHSFIAGGTGTFCEGRTRAIFEALGIIDEVEIVDVELNAAPNAIRNKRVTGYATCSSHPVPGLVELSTTVPVRILSFTDEQRETLAEADPSTGPVVISAGTYNGQEEDVHTVGLPVGAFGTAAMDDDTAYTIVKAFWEQRESLATENPWWAGVSPDMIEQMAVQLHPGAQRYYEEEGIAVPDSMK